MHHIFQAFFLGTIQGLTEFLPVSSSGHLILAPYFFKFEDPGLAFDVALHMGTLVAILICFWKDWIMVVQNFLEHFSSSKSKKKEKDIVSIETLILATIPAAVAGLFLNKMAEEELRSPILIAVTLSLFGALLYYADLKGTKRKALLYLESHRLEAVIIGCSQALALIPGVSRSGSTLTAALLLGLSRPAALRFSFLLSAPIIAGAGLMKFKSILTIISQGGEGAMQVLVGFLASLFFGILAIQILRRVVFHHNFRIFSYYRFFLSFIIIVVVIFR